MLVTNLAPTAITQWQVSGFILNPERLTTWLSAERERYIFVTNQVSHHSNFKISGFTVIQNACHQPWLSNTSLHSNQRWSPADTNCSPSACSVLRPISMRKSGAELSETLECLQISDQCISFGEIAHLPLPKRWHLLLALGKLLGLGRGRWVVSQEHTLIPNILLYSVCGTHQIHFHTPFPGPW